MSPQWPNFILSANIPHVELDIFVGDRLDVEANCGDRSDILIQFELVQYS